MGANRSEIEMNNHIKKQQEELDTLRKQYLDKQVADALYWERKHVGVATGGGLIDAVINSALLAYSATAPSKKDFQNKVAIGALD